MFYFFFLFFNPHQRTFSLIFRERGREGEREGGNLDVKEQYQSAASFTRPNWNQTCNLIMCPDPESKPQPFGVRGVASTNPATPARAVLFLNDKNEVCIFFFNDFIYLFLERGREGERGRETQCVVASCVSHTGDLACSPGMCPDWELNWQPFGPQTGTQSTKLHQPGQKSVSFDF